MSSMPLSFIPVKDLCSQPEPTKWLINGFLNAESMASIFGEPGSMKSFLAIDQGLCVATGIPWHGHQINKNGPVFYICGEGFSGIKKRVKAWSIDHCANLDEVPFFVSSSSVQILDPCGEQELVRAIEELASTYGCPILVIIDTLNRNFGSGDENSTSDMTSFVAKLDSIRNRYHCAALIIHHTGVRDTSRARGASALRASLDWEYQLRRDKSQGVVILSCTKSKDFDEPKPVSFKPQAVEIEDWADPDNDYEPMSSCVLVETEHMGKNGDVDQLHRAEQIAYNVLETLYNGQPVGRDAWLKAAINAEISKGVDSSKRKAFSRAERSLIQKGLVFIKDGLYWLDVGQGTPL